MLSFVFMHGYRKIRSIISFTFKKRLSSLFVFYHIQMCPRQIYEIIIRNCLLFATEKHCLHKVFEERNSQNLLRRATLNEKNLGLACFQFDHPLTHHFIYIKSCCKTNDKNTNKFDAKTSKLTFTYQYIYPYNLKEWKQLFQLIFCQIILNKRNVC